MQAKKVDRPAIVEREVKNMDAARGLRLKLQTSHHSLMGRLSNQLPNDPNKQYTQVVFQAYDALLASCAAKEARDMELEAEKARLSWRLKKTEVAYWMTAVDKDVTAVVSAAKKAAVAAIQPRTRSEETERVHTNAVKAMREERAAVKKGAPSLGLASGATDEAVEAEVGKLRALLSTLEEKERVIRERAYQVRSSAPSGLAERCLDSARILGAGGSCEAAGRRECELERASRRNHGAAALQPGDKPHLADLEAGLQPSPVDGVGAEHLCAQDAL